MSVWIWPVNPENWPLVKAKKVWSVGKLGKGKRVVKGDKIIFYVNGTLYFHGIFEVTSDWHEPTVAWPNETQVGQIAVSEIDLKEIQLGFASVNKLLLSLNFIEKKTPGLKGLYLRGTPQGPANSAKPISESDYNLILEELKSVQTEPDFKKQKERENEFEELVEIPDRFEEIEKIPAPEKKTIAEIFIDADKGNYAIPDFQRAWTWTRGQIEELWESIFKAYYIGSLLLWEASGRELGANPVQGADSLVKNPDMVLDGQQRTTAVYYAIKSPPMSLPNTEYPYVFFLDINALLDPNRPSSDIISGLRTKKAERKGYFEQKIQFEKKIFPLTELKDKNYMKWLFHFRDYLMKNEGFNEETATRYYQRLESIFSYVWSSYEIPIVKLPESMSLENVVEVFERINSKGTRLDVFDLLNARFKIHDIVLRDLWQKTIEDHKNIRAWFEDFKNEKIPQYILQAMALYKNGFARRRYLLRIDEAYSISGEFQREIFEKDWQFLSKFVEEAITRLTSTGSKGFGAVNYDFIPYTTMVPILASLLMGIDTREDRTKCLEKIGFWYWNNIIDDKYSGSTDTAMENDVKEMNLWFDDDSLRIFSPKEIPDDFATAKSSSAIYKSIMCLIGKHGALDFVRDDPAEFNNLGNLEDHHIFPKSKAHKYNAGDKIDSILNRTLIFGKTNRDISNNITLAIF